MLIKTYPCPSSGEDGDEDAYCEHCANGHEPNVLDNGSVVHAIYVSHASLLGLTEGGDSVSVSMKKKKKSSLQSGLADLYHVMGHPPVKPRFKSIRKPRPIP